MIAILSALGSIANFLGGVISALTSWAIFRRGEAAQQQADLTAALNVEHAELKADICAPRGEALLDELREGKA